MYIGLHYVKQFRYKMYGVHLLISQNEEEKISSLYFELIKSRVAILLKERDHI